MKPTTWVCFVRCFYFKTLFLLMRTPQYVSSAKCISDQLMYSSNAELSPTHIFLLSKSPDLTNKKDPISSGGDNRAFQRNKVLIFYVASEKRKVAWLGVGVDQWLGDPSPLVCGCCQQSHVGAHPGLAVGWCEFTLAAFSGWRLRSGHNTSEALLHVCQFQSCYAMILNHQYSCQILSLCFLL